MILEKKLDPFPPSLYLYKGGINVIVNNQGHMTKMTAMPIYGITPSKIFYRTAAPISTKLSRHVALGTRVLQYAYKS